MMVSAFRNKSTPALAPIRHTEVGVESSKVLMDNKFNWLSHINKVYKKGQSTSCFILKGNSPLVSGQMLFSHVSPA